MIRHGECNHCGHCCHTFARQPVVRIPEQVAADPDFYAARGFRALQIDGRPVMVLLASLVAPCPQHQGERCAIEDAKPRTCREFPTQPRDIVETPCSYWFEGEGVRLGGLGSPVPSTLGDLVTWEQTAA
jgi:Fe-S-cluster containining protein